MAMNLQRNIDIQAVGGIKIDSSNVLLNIGKSPISVDWIRRSAKLVADAKIIWILGEEIHASSWSGAERVGLDLVRDEFKNIYSINEFVKDRFILTEKFPIAVYITENFRLTTKFSSGMRSSGYEYT